MVSPPVLSVRSAARDVRARLLGLVLHVTGRGVGLILDRGNRVFCGLLHGCSRGLRRLFQMISDVLGRAGDLVNQGLRLLFNSRCQLLLLR